MCACLINVSTAWFERLVKDAAYLKLNQLWVELKVKSDTHPESVEWGYYTKPQIAALQRLADQYHVTIVPEVNSPGHIEPWIRNRPDLQLTDSAGQKQVSRLDITKPEAFEFLTDIIDENLSVFRTPYWHMGADEYMLGSDYARYPQLLAYAREKFGPNAVPQDAFVDFINRINAHVKAKGKTLRIWNDGITAAATVPLDQRHHRRALARQRREAECAARRGAQGDERGLRALQRPRRLQDQHPAALQLRLDAAEVRRRDGC